MVTIRRGVLLALALLFVCVQGYKHHALEISKDHRQHIFLGNFGYNVGGYMRITVNNFTLADPGVPYSELKTSMYFLLRITQMDTYELLEDEVTNICKTKGYDDEIRGESQRVLDQDWSTEPEWKKNEEPLKIEGLYNLYFINCDKQPVSFKIRLEQYNVIGGNKDYLPIGLSPLPTIYGVFAAIYFVMFFVWIFAYMRGAGNTINKVHYLMSVLVVVKFLSLLFYAIDQHYLKITGVPGGWAIAYYIFAILNTLFFFVIIALIGTGWSFFKPFLSDKDKKIIMVVLPLQILDNIAMVIIDVTDPGDASWLTWKNIFRLVDIICCGAILIPIIWSIKHLREASQIDGKAARNLQKLQLFRQFYLIVVSYIYFTRIIIYLLDATLPYKHIWLGQLFTELATLSFFLVVGYKFRPTNGNPYFNLEEEDAARLEEMRNMDAD